ncbi:PTS sugar transporter subunit IIA [Clostridium fungisolvens]|uniref:PTS system beta-glucoside-specific EIIBCA component n=1 Tax=Clostridium fungisolvens TaxID=1604897 RepID=A0A6V8SEB4_9CLOT|nr:PTS glucose transporter subunit IIA [Clostridium fungisolvens]GFP75056.1 PTS system beta-glucoside-specific EIIBCA component [Clostridium fungisolvens]
MGVKDLFKNIFRSKERSNNTRSSYNNDNKFRSGEIVYSPLEGEVRKLSEVNDPTFGQELMGKGMAIEPTRGRVVAPVDGEIVAIFNTKHALALKSKDGVEVLIHVGIDTVNLEGRYFKAHVDQGFDVKAGELLVEFDIEKIRNEGYDVITSVVITNTDDYKEIRGTEAEKVKETEPFIQVIR